MFLSIVLLLVICGIFYYSFPQQQQFVAPLIVSISPLPSAQPIDRVPNANLEAEAIYLLINAHRKDQKLAPLEINPQLEKSAQLKLADMITNKYYRHADEANTEPWHFFRQSGYSFTSAGENLSFNLNTPWQVTSNWIQSTTHNEQLLNETYKHMGLAIDCTTFAQYADGGCIVVLHLGNN